MIQHECHFDISLADFLTPSRHWASLSCFLASFKFLAILLRDFEPKALIPPTIYYSKVGFELSKLVFRGRKMNPPYVAPPRPINDQQGSSLLISSVSSAIEAFQSYITPLAHVIRHPTSFFSAAESTANSLTMGGILSRIRNINRQELASAGIITAEVLGFFTVGEMIGRFKLVGYRGDVEHH